jgi:hypothetical protein
MPNLHAQLQRFRTLGFVIIKRPQLLQVDALNSLHGEILSYFYSQQSAVPYRIWRYFHGVATPENRHAIPLPMSLPGLKDTLNLSVGTLRPLLDNLLTGNDQSCESTRGDSSGQECPLVELSSVIALPGAGAQEQHSDTSYSSSHLIVSAFVALRAVPRAAGPTCFLPSSHSRGFHRRYGEPARRVYGSDGELEPAHYFYPEAAEEAAAAAAGAPASAGTARDLYLHWSLN